MEGETTRVRRVDILTAGPPTLNDGDTCLRAVTVYW